MFFGGIYCDDEKFLALPVLSSAFCSVKTSALLERARHNVVLLILVCVGGGGIWLIIVTLVLLEVARECFIYYTTVVGLFYVRWVLVCAFVFCTPKLFRMTVCHDFGWPYVLTSLYCNSAVPARFFFWLGGWGQDRHLPKSF